MYKMNLSNRLKTVASLIPKGSVLADIGTDHAYLPIYALQNGIICRAICGDVREGPLLAARKNVREANLEDEIVIRKGDGLAVIEPDDQVDCITICGMGGSLITSILEQGKDQLTSVKALILQPNNAAEQVRHWLINHNWKLAQEIILEEEGHIYEILLARPDSGVRRSTYSEKALLFGPFLLKEKSVPFQKKWAREKREWIRILDELQKAEETPEIQRKKADLERKINWYEEVFSNETTERS